MGSTNLGLIFGATLAGSDGDPSDTAGLARMSVQSNIVETLLVNYNQIFGDEGDEEEKGVDPVDHDHVAHPGGDAIGYHGHDYDYDEQQLHHEYGDREHDNHYEQSEHTHTLPEEYYDNGSEPASAVDQRFGNLNLQDGMSGTDEFGGPQDQARYMQQQHGYYEQQEQGGAPHT
jgi:hypothetical protein